MISILGIPTDRHSSYMTGAAQAPPIIMQEFNSDATNKFSENGIDLGQENIWMDLGCLDLKDHDKEFELIRNAIQTELKIGNYLLNVNSRIVSDNNNNLKLTEKEIKIIIDCH